MGTKERKEREKTERKKAIVVAAERVFFSKGYEKSTMDDVAKEAELSKGTLYLYFDSKESLYFEIIEKGTNILDKLFKSAISGKKNGLSKVKAIGEAFIQFYTKYPDYNEAMLYGHSRLHKANNPEIDCNTCGEEGFKNILGELFVQTIIEGVEDGSIRKDIEPVKTALILWGETMGVIQLLLAQKDGCMKVMNINPKEFIAYYFELTEKSLIA